MLHTDKYTPFHVISMREQTFTSDHGDKKKVPGWKKRRIFSKEKIRRSPVTG
jgi:hypothetical protein